METTTFYQKWIDGDLSNEAALSALCRTLVGIEDSLGPLTEMQKETRAQISEVVERMGGKVQLEGFGEMKITEPSRIISYKREDMEKLVTELLAEGHGDIAERIVQSRSETGRAGSLRIERLRGVK